MEEDFENTLLEANNIKIEIPKELTHERKYIPTDIYIETIALCNAKCPMCPNRHLTRAKAVMDMKTFKNIIDKIKDEKINYKPIYIFLHFQGEPMLDGLLVERVKYIKSKLDNTDVGFSTNGHALTKDKSEKLIKEGLDFIVISIDAVTKETHAKLRVGLDYDKVFKNVNDLIENKKKLKSNIRIMTQMVVNETNKHEIKEFIKLWEEKGVNVAIKPMHNFLSEKTSYFTNENKEKQMFPCLQPFLYFVVYWDGDIGLCCWDADKQFKIGNINDKSILELFNSDIHKKVREGMLKMDCSNLPLCSSCSQIYGYDMNMAIFDKQLRVKK